MKAVKEKTVFLSIILQFLNTQCFIHIGFARVYFSSCVSNKVLFLAWLGFDTQEISGPISLWLE